MDVLAIVNGDQLGFGTVSGLDIRRNLTGIGTQSEGETAAPQDTHMSYMAHAKLLSDYLWVEHTQTTIRQLGDRWGFVIRSVSLCDLKLRYWHVNQSRLRVSSLPMQYDTTDGRLFPCALPHMELSLGCPPLHTGITYCSRHRYRLCRLAASAFLVALPTPLQRMVLLASKDPR